MIELVSINKYYNIDSLSDDIKLIFINKFYDNKIYNKEIELINISYNNFLMNKYIIILNKFEYLINRWINNI
jgi:hypothetical protein